ncbi:hypothetical protein IMCC3317_30140 [Kordia antarctica]|uniref:Uncharacterized protein n=1 Tax=Kordia antarctica TaxID=1218801 RepID=A0A7L4ZNZ8_9FLAO|nr:hypothetical protein [Kordia antarctica]QHI37634.1 hypothetical protein IMCC3317_30140 [Kordia antarctica]
MSNNISEDLERDRQRFNNPIPLPPANTQNQPPENDNKNTIKVVDADV